MDVGPYRGQNLGQVFLPITEVGRKGDFLGVFVTAGARGLTAIVGGLSGAPWPTRVRALPGAPPTRPLGAFPPLLGTAGASPRTLGRLGHGHRLPEPWP